MFLLGAMGISLLPFAEVNMFSFPPGLKEIDFTTGQRFICSRGLQQTEDFAIQKMGAKLVS